MLQITKQWPYWPMAKQEHGLTDSLTNAPYKSFPLLQSNDQCLIIKDGGNGFYWLISNDRIINSIPEGC